MSSIKPLLVYILFCTCYSGEMSKKHTFNWTSMLHLWEELEKLWWMVWVPDWQSISTVGRMVRYYFALAYKMIKMSKSAFLLKMEVPESENLS